jgi:choline dehydrogenase-like flavoprotein
MLVTSIPAALARGASLVTSARAQRLVLRGDRVIALEARAMDPSGVTPAGRLITLRARHFISAAGAIGTPALLLRSALPDPHHLVGKRTFLHPSVVSAARMPETIDGFAGAPQSIYTDHFLDSAPIDGPIGYKLEAPPLHPLLTATTFPGDGNAHAHWMREFRHMHVVIALLRDGFHPESAGGTVRLRDDGTPVLDYPLGPFVWEGVRRALLSMARIQFAAGALQVIPAHAQGPVFDSLAQAEAAITAFDLRPLVTRVVSAHVMGGAPMGPDPQRSVVDVSGRHHQVANLHVFDGSLFPTSIGANPQLSIYALAARLASALAQNSR